MRGNIALTVLVSSFSGLLLTGSGIDSFRQAVFIWFVMIVVCGALLPTREDEHLFTTIKRSLFPSIFHVGVIAQLLYFHYTFAATYYDAAPDEPIAVFGRSFPYYVLSENIFTVVLLSAFLLLGTLVAISLSSLANLEIKKYATSLWNFGPQGINRMDKLLRSIIALIGTFYLLSVIATSN